MLLNSSKRLETLTVENIIKTKWIISTKCFWAHVGISFIKSCIWQCGKPHPCLWTRAFWRCCLHGQSWCGHLSQMTLFTCKRLQQVLLELSTTFTVFCYLFETCQCIKFRTSWWVNTLNSWSLYCFQFCLSKKRWSQVITFCFTRRSNFFGIWWLIDIIDKVLFWSKWALKAL